MSKTLVSVWVYEEDRDFIKIEAAKRKEIMPDTMRHMRLAYEDAEADK